MGGRLARNMLQAIVSALALVEMPVYVHPSRRAVLTSAAFAVATPAVARAEEKRRKMPSLFADKAKRIAGVYSDDLHPGCQRVVSVERSGSKYIAYFQMSDVGPPGIGNVVKIACDEVTEQKYELRQWSFEAEVSDDGERIDAKDGVHVGRYRVASKDDASPWEGIRWQDGNRWVQQKDE